MQDPIEDVYALSPMQAGILFHSLYADERAVYLDQHAFEIEGHLDVQVFEQAWQHLIRRHSVLRTTFHWDKVEEALQVVHSQATLPLERLDWTNRSQSEQAGSLESFLADDRKRGIDLSTAPLMRLSLIRLGPASWRFVWLVHHLILDRWSIDRLLAEFTVAYEVLNRKRPIELPAIRPYSQYIQWIQSQNPTRAECYWRERLAGFIGPTTLPIDRAPGSPSSGGQTAQSCFKLSESVTQSLLGFARERRLTLNTVIQGAWAILLSRYSGRQSVLFGSTVSGRPPAIPGVESMVGLFINSLPVRVKVPHSDTLDDWLQRLQGELAELREYEHSSLLQIQSWSDVPRGVPLFDSLVIVQNTSGGNLDQPAGDPDVAGALRVRPIASHSTVDFPLMLLAVPGKDLSLWLSYDAGRYDSADIARLLGHLGVLLEGFVAHPQSSLNSLPLLTESEHLQLITWNQTERDYLLEGGIHELIEDQAARTPDAPAVVFEGSQLSYRELNERANRLANYFRRQGVGPDRLVGIHMERSAEMIVSILATLKAGGAYVPLDPTYPPERVAGMIRDSQPIVVLTQSHLTDSPLSAISIDEAERQAGSEPSDDPAHLACGDNLAYMIYTSGSTGTPKGAMNTHSAIRNRLLWMQDEYGLGTGDRVLQKTPFSFDVSVWEFLWPLMTGACLVVARPEGHKDPLYLSEVIGSEEITTLHFVPSMLRAFLAAGDLPRCKSLRRAICSGEALPPDLVTQFFEKFGANVELHNLYGPTEAAIDVTYFACRSGEANNCIPIGRPIANTQIHILDRHMSPVPVGVPGELYIGGANLGRGYLDRPDLTAERFVPNPLSTLNSQLSTCLYRTGDLCRYQPDGNIEFLGRLDNQVKVRGFRIELGEIESALLSHPTINDCVVVAREESAGESRLIAYMVGRVPAAELRDHLKATLPDYMIPAAFVSLDALPLSPNGKVDRKLLPAPDFTGISGATVLPRTPIEEALAEIWRDVLRLDSVGVNDSFFELGGHSLLATQVVSRIRSIFQTDVSLRSLFERPTIAALADLIEQARGSMDATPYLERIEWLGPRPLSFAQERLWFLDQLESRNPAYNIANAVRLNGNLDVGAFERALTEVVSRHEALRTTFALVDGEPLQIVGESLTRLIQIDLNHDPNREEIARQLIEQEARRPFDLTRGPLLRASLIKLDDDVHVVLITLHHIVADGWSLGVLSNELSMLYNAFLKGNPSPLPELPLQYADYAVWQRSWLQGEALERQVGYWKGALADAPALLELPTDRPRPAVRTVNGGRKRLDIPSRLTQEIKTLGQLEGATLFMTLLAAFQTLLYRYTGQDQVVVGTPIANRTQSSTEGLIGFFANTLALRGDLSADPTFVELLGRVRETCLGAYAHQDLPFEKLVDEIQPERSTGHSPIFQVMFMLQNTPAEPDEFDGLRIEPARAESVTAKYDLVLGASESRGQLKLGLEYNTDLFDGDRIERLLGHFQILLEAVVSNPNQRLSELPILTEPERRQVLSSWNQTEYPFPDRRLHQLIEAQVDRTPDAVAVRFEESTLTYRELEKRANRLANHFRTLGIGPESYVGVYMERSLDLLVALLAVLKAGGAYVPLDPEYPSARIAYMLSDSQVYVILTHESVATTLPNHSGVTVDVNGNSFASCPATRPEVAVDPEHPAYVIYTSGTTGRPKGVVVPHRAIVNHMHWMQHSYPLEQDDRVIQKTPISFDASVWECWAPLMVGGELIVARPGGHMDSEYLVGLIHERGITAIKLVPSLLRMLLEEECFADCRSLRYVFCGAEALTKDLHDRFFAIFGDRVQLSNLYGPTEAAIDAVGCLCSGKCSTATVPIGSPISNCTAYVLDRSLRPVPVGIDGELYLGGANLARGYLNAPHLTATSFIPNPFSQNAPGQGGSLDSRLRGNDESPATTRLYKTGDRARHLPDGSIEFLGRVDHQVKVRGFRIELGEIETALRSHDSLNECVVVSREDVLGEQRIAAYVAGNSIDVPSLRQHLKGLLPDYMIPSSFTLLDAVPLTPAGKVDAKALPAPDFESIADVETPGNPTEELVAGIWAELLRRDYVGTDDNFFDLGGHSLLATQAMARIRATFGVDVPLRALFEYPTVSGLSTVIDECRRSGAGLQMPALKPRASDEAAPLSFSQERLWFLYQMERDSYLYNMPRALRLTGELNLDALRQALNELVARHNVLRTTYETRDGKAVQVIGPAVEFPLSIDDFSELSEDIRDEAISHACLIESTTPFDLGSDLMLRAKLLRLGEQEHVLLLTVHHIASDGWSNAILMSELTRLYNAHQAGQPAQLPALSVQYPDFAAWQREWFIGDVLERQVSYWRDRLAGAPPVIQLPTDRPREEATGYTGGMHRFLIPEMVADSVRELCREERATQFMTLLAGFNILLRHWTGETDLVVGTDSAGRTLPETERLIGFFLNHLVLRTDLSGDPSFREVVRRVREVCLGAYAHQDLPFDKLVEVVHPERGVTHTPVFQVLFVMQNTPRSTTSLTGIEIARVEVDFPASKFDLALFLVETSRGLSGMWVYRTELFDASTIERLSRQYLWLLDELVSNPDKQIEDLEIPTDPVEAPVEENQLAAVRTIRRRSAVST